jgi:hypothetical protein
MAPAAPQQLYVCKRNGEEERVSFDKITKRIQTLSNNLSDFCDPVRPRDASVAYAAPP